MSSPSTGGTRTRASSASSLTLAATDAHKDDKDKDNARGGDNDDNKKPPLAYPTAKSTDQATPGIPITRLRSLEPSSSPAAPLARMLSGGPGAPQHGGEEEQFPNEYPGSGTAEDPFLVDWLPCEQANPYNWSKTYRWATTGVIALANLCISYSSSSYSGGIDDIRAKFGVGQEVAVLGISLYVVGFGVGPLLWAPLSEIYGRSLAFLASYPLFVLWNLMGALSPNMACLLVSRFLAGTFGSSPITNAGGQVADMFAPHERALATSLFSLAPFLGPVLGPIVGGFVGEQCGFRVVLWVQFAFGGVCCLIHLLLVPETYAPTLLRRKALRLTREAEAAGTHEHFIAKHDAGGRRAAREVLCTNLARPFQLIAHELIVACLGVYLMIVYGTLYLFFEAFPIVFRLHRGWTQGMAGLAFVGIGVGLVLGNAVTPVFERGYKRAVAEAAAKGEKVAPEARLVGCAVGAVLLPVGLFWFAWTCQPSVHWIVPMLASVPFGTGFLLIFTGVQLYLIDAYALYAASALASNAVLRSLSGAAFPLFSTIMYTNLGINWAGTLVAFLSLACTPMPFAFIKWGGYLRRNSQYSPSGYTTKTAAVDEKKCGGDQMA